MLTLIITRGYPGSGKTTEAMRWVQADPERRARVNRDELRKALFNKYTGLSGAQEVAVTTAQRAAVTALIKAGKSVVVDDTNLRLRVARGWADLAVELGVEFGVHNVLTPAEACVYNDLVRGSRIGGRFVGVAVIEDYAKRFPIPWPDVLPHERKAGDPPAKYVPDSSKPAAIIVDLDGTLAHNVTGRDFVGEGLKHVYEDEVDDLVLDVVDHYWGIGRDVIFMSGRNESARKETMRWLHDKAGFHHTSYELFMRADGDSRSDFIVKAELFDEHVRDNYNVKLCLDDRNQVVELWRGMGIPTWQVAPGNF